MAKPHLNNDVFMSELTLMFHNSRKEGQVSVTVKRDDGRTRPYPKPRKLKNGKMSKVEPLPEPEEYSCLLRAKTRDKKISTVVITPPVSVECHTYVYIVVCVYTIHAHSKPHFRINSLSFLSF
ncbi:signal recognition particle 14 kDa protein-like [Penaeus monodon]|uniref:signal recognition particle 14 kDa protein-like n=1 Tax=Penaeus monodon TaxID=6687 RepID=UPI0018A6F135|nr:signal recognition particle 14 kDa protein-like [Penaeus monodon]